MFLGLDIPTNSLVKLFGFDFLCIQILLLMVLLSSINLCEAFTIELSSFDLYTLNFMQNC